MESRLIKIIKPVASDSIKQRFGGVSFLPESIQWPVNSNREKLTLIFSIPTSFLNENCNTDLDINKWVSVFSTYNNDYFLDEVIDNGDTLLETEKIFNNFTKIILHDKGNPRNESEFLILSFLIEVEDGILKSSNAIPSKIGGTPNYLQNKVLEADSMQFCFQFLSEDLPDCKNVLYLEDAIGYLFVSNNKPFKGLFFGQCT